MNKCKRKLTWHWNHHILAIFTHLISRSWIIYTVRITANRQNYCSMLTENEIHLNKIGFYRITASGEQSVRGHATTEFNIFLTRDEEQPTNISRKVFLTSSTFNFITFLKVDTLCKLSMQIELRPSNKRCEFSANFLVELL